jgi:hypothetical protein
MYTTDAPVRVDPPDLNELGVSPLDRQSLPPTPSLSNEIAVMQSRSVAEPIIQRFDYDISTTPRSLPIRGAIAKKFAVDADRDKSSGLGEVPYSDELREWAVELANAQLHTVTAMATREHADSATLTFTTNELPRLCAEVERRANATGGAHIVDQSRCAARRICFAQSVPPLRLARLETRGPLYFEPACSSSRQRLLWHAWTLGEA